MIGLAPTERQLAYVQGLQRRLRLPDALLDNHCVSRFGVAFAALGRAQVSALIDELIAWEQMPDTLEMAKGQMALPGMRE